MTEPAPVPEVGGPPRQDMAAAHVSPWNIANYLTVVRIILVPIFGWLLLAQDGTNATLRWAAFVVFVLAMVTDRIDGDLARKHGLITNFGKVLDPIADKLLVTMALVGLSMILLVPWWITIVILVREWGITAMRFWVIRHGVMAAGRGGKLKTTLQAIALGAYILPVEMFPFAALWVWVAWILLMAALLITVVTGIDYVIDALRLRQTSPRAEMKRARRAERDRERPSESGPPTP